MQIEKAQAMVAAIIRDISNRSGLGDAWDEIDDETQDEIRKAWAEVIFEIANDL